MERTYRSKAILLIFVCSFGLVTNISNGKSELTKRSPSSRTLRSMARVYMSYGEYAKAQPLAENALNQAQSQGAPDSEIAMCLIDLSTLYNYQGKLADAEKLCKSGLSIQRKTLYKYHPYLACTVRLLSSIYYEQGRYDEAKSTIDEAITIMHNYHITDDDVAMSPFFVDTAKILTAEGKLDQAESYYRKAMPPINGNYGPDHLYTANVIADIAKLYVLQERYSEAEELINHAISIQEKTYGSNHHLVCASWLTKATICQRNGELAQAEKLVSKSLAVINKSGNAEAFTKLQEDARNIRADIKVSYEPVAKATPKNSAVNN